MSAVSKYMRREVAKDCPVHQIILETCQQHLLDHGYFNKEAVVKEAGFPAQLGTSYLRWDYIADFLRVKEQELIPLAARFWKMNPQERIATPEKAIATGHGKKTAGYALVTVDEGALAVSRMIHKRNLTNGVGKAFRAYTDELIKKGVKQLNEPETRKLADTITN